MGTATVSDSQTISLLLIEDHHDIAEMVYAYLERRGFVVDYAADGLSGLQLATTNPYEVIVLDLMLPGLDGIELCQKLRQEAKKDTPLLMLTARDTLPDKVAGLEAGADDYLVKPFEIQELEARARALVRRHRGQVSPKVLQVADLVLDTGTCRVQRAGQELTLTPIGFRLLSSLMQASPRVVSRRELERDLWGEFFPDSDALRSHLYNLRKIIDKPFEQPLLQTIPGMGYRLAEPEGG